MVALRGEIWWADLPEPSGSGPGYRRPVVVVQSDDFNQSRISTVIAVAVTTNLNLAHAPGNILLSRKASKLPKESVVNVSQVITFDKAFLADKVGRLPARIFRRIEEGLKLVLAL